MNEIEDILELTNLNQILFQVLLENEDLFLFLVTLLYENIRYIFYAFNINSDWQMIAIATYDLQMYCTIFFSFVLKRILMVKLT